MLREALPKIITESVPGPKSKALIDRRHAAVPDAIGCAYPVAIKRGEGAMVEDLDGNYFLDWVGGVGVLNVGYSQPAMVEAVKEQAERFFHGMFNIVTHEGYVALAEKLNEIGDALAEEYGIAYLNSDFKKKNGYKRSVELSEQYGMYRQYYCGCVFSKNQRDREIALKNQ